MRPSFVKSAKAPLPSTEPRAAVGVKKITGSFPSRAAAQKALRALRQAGYASKEIRVLHSLPPATIYREGIYDVFSKYVRHYLNPRRIRIRVSAPQIEAAQQIFHECDAEVMINQFFHQTGPFSGSEWNPVQAVTPFPMRHRSE